MNVNLNDLEWKEFVLDDIFEVSSPADRIDKSKLNKAKGAIPYISRTDRQNGIDDFVGVQEKYRINAKNAITIGDNTQTAFYQSVDFYTAEHIQIIRNDKLNRHNALFILVFVKKMLSKFSWGNAATVARLKRSKILLPINSQGEPDYEFMEKFMRQIEQKQIQIQLDYMNKKLVQVKHCDFNAVKWKEFKISDIFEISGTTTTHPSKLLPNGKTPRITCAATNNGLDDVYANKPTENGGVLTIDSATTAYIGYQECDFIATDHVEKITLKDKEKMNRYVGLFMKQCIDKAVTINEKKEIKKYAYGYKFSQTRIKRQIIKLPINSQGEPDYEFMENFMRAVEQKHLKKAMGYYSAKFN